MSSSPPPDGPHHNGLNLSPTSPKPRHIAELQTIPVLEKQHDPIFNLVSTHMETPSAPVIEVTPNPIAEDLQSALKQPFGGNVHHEEAAIASTDYNPPNDPDRQNENTNEVRGPFLSEAEVPTQITVSEAAQGSVAQEAMNESLPHPIERLNVQIEESALDLADPIPKSTDAEPHPDQGAAFFNGKFGHDGGDMQALLDNLIASASAAPQTESSALTVDTASLEVPQTTDLNSVQTPLTALPTPVGLPPRPPPQDESAERSRHVSNHNLSMFPNPGAQPAIAASTTHLPTTIYTPQSGLSSDIPGSASLPPPPPASFEAPTTVVLQQAALQQNIPDYSRGAPGVEPKQQPEADSGYQAFLKDEATYVSEGTWDRFPQGSRLFVGNLFTERVSKRQLYDIFSRYGRLAQISMKNAYGFIQFVDPGCSTNAMMTEEGIELGGRKIHLEISKPQKNSRNATATAAGEALRASQRPIRRSRSPDYGRSGARNGGSRQSSSGFAGYDRNGRDEYRPMRSPSPVGARRYDSYGSRYGSSNGYGAGRRSRSRSPYGRAARYRSRTPPSRDIDDEVALPIQRRHPAQVPDVQIILVDESDRTFVGYIQQSFRDRGLRCEVLQMPRGCSLKAVIKRQIVEGVQAVVRVLRQSQVTGKIPLQLFDRSGGLGNIRFDDYEELDANVAADIVVRAKANNPPPQQPPPPQYPYNSANVASTTQYGQSAYGQGPNSNSNQSVADALSSMDPAALQKLLGTVNNGNNQNHLPNGHIPNGQTPQDLAAILSSVARGTPQQSQHGYQPPSVSQQQPPYNYQPQPPQQQQFANNPAALAQLLALQQGGNSNQYGSTAPSATQTGSGGQQNVQDIMAQLAKYRQ